MKTLIAATALLMLLASAASAQRIAQANPYAACLAQAGPQFGSLMTIEDLDEYMRTHPDCKYIPVPVSVPPSPKQQAIETADCIVRETAVYRHKIIPTRVRADGTVEERVINDFLTDITARTVLEAVQHICHAPPAAEPRR